jgi:ribosomal protein L7Ae-like RNA K-turn-binding protein
MILLWDIKNKKEVKYHLISNDVSIKNILESFYQLKNYKQYKIINIESEE